MIKINKEKDIITMTGHSMPDICAAISSIMYTSVNALLKYNETAIEYKDENDIITIEIKKHDTIIDLLINNMFDMFEDVLTDYGDDYIQIKRC